MNKYLNKKTETDGILFDSMKEATRYLYLKSLQVAGEIAELECQPVFKYMSDNGKKVLFKYIADFKYKKQDEIIIEDVKSPMTAKLPLFRLKKKLIEDRYRIKIDIV